MEIPRKYVTVTAGIPCSISFALTEGDSFTAHRLRFYRRFPYIYSNRRCTIAKAIMIQGTMSSAGKSMLCAGLCRVFRQDGYRVAPFKSQNMALNSYITEDGLEMGHAQAVQAQAAGILPDVRMNPVLLKPVAHMGSQVIVLGEVLGTMSAREYYKTKHTLLPSILEAYHTLEEENDILVLEGAGSPAEINLTKGDFVNMGMAKLAKAPVLLAGDIDRGGVFAQLYGTIALLSSAEKDIVKATIINKFRGDVTLLKEGLTMLENLTMKPVAGVLPYLDVDIDDEDSLAERLKRKKSDAVLDIAVIRFPRISNFTDFSVLEATPGVGIRYVSTPKELAAPDLLILPGTKSTLTDLRWLKESGLAAGTQRLASEGIPILGICGGYQMLGEELSDPDGVDGGGQMRGLGLLPITTLFTGEKTRSRKKGKIESLSGKLQDLSGAEVEGYEIHMGKTTLLRGAQPLLRFDDGAPDGCRHGNIYGTYLHGFFDAASCREALFRALTEDGQLEVLERETYREQQYDALARGLREHLNMPLIYSILEKGL